MENQRFEFANALRGPAAIAVLISHYMHNAWIRRPMIATLANATMPPESVVQTPLYIDIVNSLPFFDWGSFGVAVFFLISGFVIPISLRRYSTGAFLIGRAFRIWPTYLAGFLVTLTALGLSGAYFGKPFPYTTTQVLIHSVPGLRDLLGGPYIDGIIWTLEAEVKFYLLCALIAPLIRKGRPSVFILPFAIAVTCFSASSFIGENLYSLRSWQLSYSLALSGRSIVFMFIGTAIYFYMSGLMTKMVATAIATALTIVFVCLVVWGPSLGFDALPGSYLAALVTFLVFAKYWKRTGKLVRYFSSISYPLYACHPVLGYAAIALVLNQGFHPKTAIVTAFALAIAAATIIHHLIEVPTHRIGQRTSRLITSAYRNEEKAVA